MFERIVVGFDGSPASRRALAVALDLHDGAAGITVVSVEENLPQYVAMRGEVDEAKQAADEYFGRLGQEALQAARARGRDVELRILRGHAAQRLVEFASEAHADLLVIGHSGHSGVWGTFLGTSAEKIVRHAPCSVLVVR
jgi:nucleotide-binding universal stress UspA family protein